MESLFKDLLRYKLLNLYDGAKTRKDNRFDLGIDYQNKLMQRNLSSHILRSQTMSDFIGFINDYLMNIIKTIKKTQQFDNFTVKKEDTRVR
jgi:hypothetical protein